MANLVLQTVQMASMLNSAGRILRQQPPLVDLSVLRHIYSAPRRTATSVQAQLGSGCRRNAWSSNQGVIPHASTVEPCSTYSTRSDEEGAAVGPLLPSIDLIVGPMFAGKSTELLRRAQAFEALGRTVVLVKSKKDDRYHKDRVVTHDGLHKDCISVDTLSDFKKSFSSLYHAAEVVAVDEAQFFPDLLDFCTKAADRDAKVILVAGLDGDFRRQQFGQVLDLLPMADSIAKLTSRCHCCDNRALFSLRVAADERQEVIGGADKYVAVCRQHYTELSDTRQRG